MKELSIEEKAKRYDEAYKVAKNIHIFSSDLAEIKRMEEIFPELKEESDGERIRKRICKLLWDNAPYEEAQEYITWLEKQGEQKATIEMKSAEESLGIDSETYSKIVDECIYGEQKPANKVEPKFKIGDNIEPIDSCLGSPRTIYKICDGFYETNQGTLNFEFENNWRLIEKKPAWSEEDDKIIEEIINDIECARAINYHDSKEGYEFRENWLESLKDRIQPQPKQEWTEEDERIIKRIDSLLYSINESEFEDIHAWLEFLKNRVQPKQEWSKEDEYYRNIILYCLNNEIVGNADKRNAISWFKFLKDRVQPKQEWSEKDKHMLQKVIDFMKHPDLIKATPTLAKDTIDWLKSLKDRVLPQPKQEWSKEDEVKINRIVACLENLNIADNDILLKDVDWLKSLKDRVGCEVNCTTTKEWKPSDEQIDELRKYSDNVVLRNLYYNLKKLKVE